MPFRTTSLDAHCALLGQAITAGQLQRTLYFALTDTHNAQQTNADCSTTCNII
jgi:hypothetical protein